MSMMAKVIQIQEINQYLVALDVNGKIWVLRKKYKGRENDGAIWIEVCTGKLSREQEIQNGYHVFHGNPRIEVEVVSVPQECGYGVIAGYSKMNGI